MSLRAFNLGIGAGLALVGAGVALVSIPAALITVGGLVLLLTVVLGKMAGLR